MEAQQTFSHFPAWPVPLDLPVHDLGEEACSYLPGRTTRIRGFFCHDMPGQLYQELLENGFRRSGHLFYQPLCRACRACQPIRVRARDFTPSKNQRRVLRRNADVRLTMHDPVPTDETHHLYQRFMEARHPGSRQGTDRETFERFLYDSPLETAEFRYTTEDGRLVGVGICDVTPGGLSSVYFYFDPAEAARSLGVFSQIREFQVAQEFGLEHVYLGYWVAGSSTMDYKANYRPHEILGADSRWRSVA